MTFDSLVKFVRDQAGPPGITGVQARRIVNLIAGKIVFECSLGEELRWPGFGTFYRKTHKGRVVKNPRTRELMTVPSRTMVGFRAARCTKTISVK